MFLSRTFSPSATARIWLSSRFPWSSAGRRRAPSPSNATRSTPPVSIGTPSARLPSSRIRSMYFDTVRALRPSMFRSFLNRSSSSMTVMGMMMRLSRNLKRAEGSCSRTLVSSTKFLVIHPPGFSPVRSFEFGELLARPLGRRGLRVLGQEQLIEDTGIFPVVQRLEGEPLLEHRVGSLLPPGVLVDHILKREDGALVVLLGVEGLPLPVKDVLHETVVGVFRGKGVQDLPPLPGVPSLDEAQPVIVHLLGGLQVRQRHLRIGAGRLPRRAPSRLLLERGDPFLDLREPGDLRLHFLDLLPQLGGGSVEAAHLLLHLHLRLVRTGGDGEKVRFDPVVVRRKIRQGRLEGGHIGPAGPGGRRGAGGRRPSPSAMLYSEVPRSSQCPSMIIAAPGFFFRKSATFWRTGLASSRMNDLS